MIKSDLQMHNDSYSILSPNFDAAKLVKYIESNLLNADVFYSSLLNDIDDEVNRQCICAHWLF